MQYCTACQKAIATIVVMDVDDLSVASSQHLCGACAEQLGLSQPKQQKFSTEMLEDLLGNAKEARASQPTNTACPGCGMSPNDFRTKGRLGCPRCYDSFRNELMPLLQRIHESQSHSGRLPCTMGEEPAGPNEEELSELRQQLEDAVRGERYEEAAQLRDQLRRAERGEA